MVGEGLCMGMGMGGMKCLVFWVLLVIFVMLFVVVVSGLICFVDCIVKLVMIGKLFFDFSLLLIVVIKFGFGSVRFC